MSNHQRTDEGKTDAVSTQELRAIKALRSEGLQPREIAELLKVSLATYYRKARPLQRLTAIRNSYAGVG